MCPLPSPFFPARQSEICCVIEATFVMAVTSFSVISSNSFTNAAFVVVRLATVEKLAAVEVARLSIASIVSMCSYAYVGIGFGAK